MQSSFLFQSFHARIRVHLLLFTLSFPFAAASPYGGNETDHEALLAFKEKISDPLGSLSTWNSSIHFCQWKGVECGREHQRVTGMSLRGLKLAGPISPFVGNLSFLRYLNLVNNTFVGGIPPEVGRLQRLEILNLGNNSLEHEIPSNISACSNLTSLWLSYNKLVGGIPFGFGYLRKLENFSIAFNNVTGPIPSSMGNLSSLKLFNAPFAYLTGEIPREFGQLKQLVSLALTGNRLSGTVPPAIYNITSLKNLDMQNNQLYGTFPSDLGVTLPNLRFFGIAQNQFFTGPLPASLSNATNLEYLVAGGNKLTGEVPNLGRLNKLYWLSLEQNQLGTGGANDLNFLSSLTNATNLNGLSIGLNLFRGVLPESFKNLSTELSVIDLGPNQITGGIPLGNFVNVRVIDIIGNQFTGVIPHDIGILKKLEYLDLSDNRFSGNIPSSFGNLSLLTYLNLSYNNLNDHIPVGLSGCQNLLNLFLSGNELSGPIPREVFGLNHLINLDLSGNRLNGSIPYEVGNLTNLQTFSVSMNNLIGEIPATLGSSYGLEVLKFRGNALQGIIPSSFNSLKGLQVLDLSQNNFSGQIPKFFEDFPLQLLNLSFNDFNGSLPEGGIFTNSSVVLISGNPQLCGGIPALMLPKCSFAKSKKISSSRAFKISISVVCGLLGLCMVAVLLVLFRIKRSKKLITSDSLGIKQLPSVSYQGLLRATDGFSADNLLGAGGYGTVYKGSFDDDSRTTVAVKVLNLSQRGASKSFIAECEALRNIRHRNLVRVLTACSGIDYQGNEFKALVYEFMINGSLEEWLYPNPREDPVPAETKRLTLLQRLNIAIDVSSAVKYLHHHCQPPIVHCDLKPSNVLLDDELVGHVGDFGLARVLVGVTQSLSEKQSSSNVVKGTIGYTAPEYGMGSEPSVSGDVYSFGVVLLEMFTGRKPTDDIFKDGLDIHTFVKNALPNHHLVAQIVDPVISEDDATGTPTLENHRLAENKKREESLIAILGVGLACSSYVESERISMDVVVSKLSVIRERLLGVR